MKQFIGILMFAAILTGLTSCYNTSIPKPDKLIEKEEFVKMMVDIYLIQGINTDFSDPNALKKKLTQTDLYYSVLKKYSVADTVFIRSLIYYSSHPKEYEKMHVQILNNLNEMELQFKPKDKLKVGTE
ncbi:MAG: DUF4296 domain-containing protein [Bacteroidota bacterium]|nr:DUF4296 domain-containing protein [Bacteroidota bacterium]